MKAYLVWNDNGEAYDDSYRYVDSVFSSYEGAARYLDGMGLKRRENRFYDRGQKKIVDSTEWIPACKHTCELGLTACKGMQCKKYADWVNSDDDDDTPPCEDYEWLFENDDQSYWFIEEYELND